MSVILGSALDVLPIVIFLFAFQRIVLGQPIKNGKQIAVGFVFVVVGLGLFLLGLEKASPDRRRQRNRREPCPYAAGAVLARAISRVS